ncbi:MFS family permease [Kitasatospora sp. MAP12-15]|uniref:MFS transporter n=1 Tax=unclassified Kitasatospora TaxID=2633591 RepID=UPI002473C2C4|nr:MFS transporter [Kitasatospora sp. MAP12-44]MDH6108811.1 MFS family permease [Kitasatospora sp. MAP12-44]
MEASPARGLFLGPLRRRNYRLFAIGQAASNTGTWMQKMAQDWLVLRLSDGDGTVLGITTALQLLPLLLLGACGGVLADRFPKRRLLLMTQAVLAVLALVPALLAATGTATLGAVYALSLVLGLTMVVDKPTLQAFIAEAVEPTDLQNALALNSTVLNLARMVGPALAGPIISVFGVGPAFVLNSLSYVVVLATLLRMDTRELRPTPVVARAKGQVRAGLRHVRNRPDLGLTLVLVGFVAGFGMNFQITTALMVTKVFHSRAAAFGLGSAALAVGAVAGSLLAAQARRCGWRRLVGAGLAFGVLEAVTGLMPDFSTFVLMLVPTGTLLLVFMTAAKARLQLAVAPEMRGRVIGLYMLASLGTTPLAAPCVGWISQTAGPRAGLVLGGVVSALAALVVGLLLGRRAAAEPTTLPGQLVPADAERLTGAAARSQDG